MIAFSQWRWGEASSCVLFPHWRSSEERYYMQPAGGAPQISFGVDAVSLKKPTSLPGVVKQRELSGTLETDEETPVRRPCSSAKARELAGSNIFGLAVDPRSGCLRHAFEEHQPNRGTPETIPRVGRGCVKVLNAAGGDGQELLSRKGHDQKVAELSGNNIFETECPIVASEKFVSVAKLKEMSGSDIFADEKPVARDRLGGIRRPPGGESSIALL
eukprot:c19854_g1_i2 orf=529-1176(-)